MRYSLPPREGFELLSLDVAKETVQLHTYNANNLSYAGREEIKLSMRAKMGIQIALGDVIDEIKFGDFTFHRVTLVSYSYTVVDDHPWMNLVGICDYYTEEKKEELMNLLERLAKAYEKEYMK